MNEQPKASVVLELLGAFRRSKAMFTAVRLGIFDQLASGPRSAQQLATGLKLNPGALKRLLDGCVALALLEREDDMYRNSPTSATFLVSDTPATLAGYVTYSDQSLYKLWDGLGDAVREGTNRWAPTFGSRASLFDHYFRDETSTRSFLAGMHGFGQLTSNLIVRAFDLSRFKHLVDLGGATGHLAVAACMTYPDLQSTVLDLPPVEKFAREHISRTPVANRVSFVGSDFFADEIPAADLYCLGRILHDWDDPKIDTLLTKIFAKLPHGGGLLVTETLVDEDRSGPVFSMMQDLNMLVCTDGRERTESEYAALLKAAGFATVEFHRTGGLVDAILALKG
ncbi:MAG TPA: class I SAM-dependent methyltransferase [Bryobacteraceae bacterium]|nr:class I SAM-dependent methyltransferase [Bryobacteraceae bacterium]